MRDNGIRRAAAFTTSAWSGYSSCTQYVEDIARARQAVGPDAPELVKLRTYFDHPLFVEMFADAVTAAAGTLPAGARLVFTAHSVPMAADSRCGPNLYSRQVALCRKPGGGGGGLPGLRRGLAVAFGSAASSVARARCRRPPQARCRTKAVIVCPIGFVADHIEVVWDLDYELRGQAEAAGIAFARAATPNADPRFARLAIDLIDELRHDGPPARVGGADPVPGCLAVINGAPCRAPHCAAAQTD